MSCKSCFIPWPQSCLTARKSFSELAELIIHSQCKLKTHTWNLTWCFYTSMYVRSCCIKNSDSPHLVSVPCLHTCVHVRMYMPAQVCQAQEVVPTFSKQSFVWNASNVNSWLSLHSHMLKIGQEWYVDTGSLLKPCKPSANLHACVGLLVVWRRPGPLRIHNHLPRGAARFSDHGHSRRIRTYMHRCNFGFTCSFASTCCNLS